MKSRTPFIFSTIFFKLKIDYVIDDATMGKTF